MPAIESSVYLARPMGEMFEYLADPENLPVWDVSVIRAAQVGSGPMVLGSRTEGTAKIMGKTFDWTSEITDLDPPHRVTYTSVTARLPFAATNTL